MITMALRHQVGIKSFLFAIHIHAGFYINQSAIVIFNDRLTARLHVGGFNLHVGVILRPLVLALNGA